MSFPFYRGQGTPLPTEPVNLPVPRRAQLQDPTGYRADAGLADAANVALLLGQPLLLTGEAGTGKTLFAYSLAMELGNLPVLKFETKSSSAAQDLFYSYDALKRFQNARGGQSDDSALPYITYRALGEAILRTHALEDVQPFLPPGFAHPGRSRSVVLIDEIDKAPRDFPNDMLNELENMYFRIPELENAQLRADPDLLPVVVVTSNSEKDLPDAFLRRCCYYHIQFPEPERLKEIVAGRLGLNTAGSNAFIDAALELFALLRQPSAGLRKWPATAELLGWMLVMRQMEPQKENPLDDPSLALRTLSNLIKTSSDQTIAQKLVQGWIDKRSQK